MALSRDHVNRFCFIRFERINCWFVYCSSNKVYVKSIIIHNNDYIDTAMAHVIIHEMDMELKRR